MNENDSLRQRLDDALQRFVASHGRSVPAEAAILEGFPRGALLADAKGVILAANSKASLLALALQDDQDGEIRQLIARAAETNHMQLGGTEMPQGDATAALELSVVPLRSELFLVIGRELTLERNLRAALVESRQRYKDFVEASSDFAWEIGPDKTFIFVSPRGALGYSAEELVGHSPSEFLYDPETFPVLPFTSDRRVEEAEVWLKRADGQPACVLTSSIPLISEAGEWRGVRGVCRDITDERERDAALARANHREQLLNYIVGAVRDEVVPENMLAAAAAATSRALGAAGCRVYRLTGPDHFMVGAEYGASAGLPELEALVKGLQEDAPPLEAIKRGWRILACATRYRHEINGALVLWKREDQGDWTDDDRILVGDAASQLGIANEQIANHDRIVKLSRTDGLTGLLNRRAFFEEELPRRINRLERSESTAALIYVDLDNFKQVNDLRGHHAGDEALLFVRDMMLEHSRPGDAVARLGGDEFVVWMDGVDMDTATGRAAALLLDSKRLVPFSGAEEYPLGLSIGVALYDPATGESIEDLIARSDAAMYKVKHGGKAGYEIAPPPKTKKSGGQA